MKKNIQHLPPQFIKGIALREILPESLLSFIYNILYHCSVKKNYFYKQEGGREVILLLELQLKKK